MAAEERIRIFRLAWDFAGSALGQPQRAVRALLPGLVGRATWRAICTFTDRSRADRLVDRFLKEPY